MNREAYTLHLSLLRSALREWESITTSCHHCKHFEAGTCRLFDGQTPPKDWIEHANPCPEWEWDSVPF